MIVIVALDNHNGMMFNHRRQSKDRALRQRIMDIASASCLWMNAFSYRQFTEDPICCKVQVDEDFLEKAGEKDYSFVEDQHLGAYEDQIDQLIVCRWNRDYPADFYLDLTLNTGKWTRVFTEDIPGSSHDEITLEVYGGEVH